MEEQLSQDDQVAVGWAWTTGSPTGQLLRERQQRGEKPTPTDDDLVAIRQEWETAGQPAPEHHVHRSGVELPDGTLVTAVSFLGGDPYNGDTAPAFGLYLDERWDPPWPHEHVAWPDFGVPHPDEVRSSLERLLARARSGELVEIGCLGGHGRTGTALACLAVLTGAPRDGAVDWVRANYCPNAVDTAEQRAFVESYGIKCRNGPRGTATMWRTEPAICDTSDRVSLLAKWDVVWPVGTLERNDYPLHW